ncbi:hypothetical protein [Candidatus Amarolinea aalborgensis]|jgi:hypothetical protein|uniref:hypothetical protein n=1 Tax=Candidatus Amarolinea aalborgensis TaxID=2249329 RepID=UPI003BF967FC
MCLLYNALTVFACLITFEVQVSAQSSVIWSSPSKVAENASAQVSVGDSSGALHLFYVEGWYDTEAGPGNQAIMYQRSDDNSWSVATDIIVSPNRTSITLDGVVVDRDGYLQVLWNDEQTLYLSTAHATAAGDPRSWQTSPVLRGPTPIADISQDANGKLHVAVRSDLFTVSYLSLAEREAAWTDLVQIDTVANTEQYAIGGVQLALSSPETIHMTWFQTAAEVNWNFWSVWYARSDDGGETWSKKEEIATPRFGASDIAVDSQGNVHLVYGRNIGYPDGRWYQWSQDGGDTWSEPALLFPQFESASGDTGGYGFATDSAGVLHMVNSFGDVSGEARAYHLEWVGDHWSSPQLLMEKHAHSPRLVTTLGNHLNFMVFAARDHEIWARSAIADAPAVEPVAVPQESANTPASQEMGVVEATATLEYSTTVAAIAEASVPTAFNAQEPRSQTTNVTPLLVSVLLAFVVIGSVVLFQLTKTRRRI